ncbi:MAG: hypothetical protein ACYCW6_17850 [Candidatus Xenobia bacterium]
MTDPPQQPTVLEDKLHEADVARSGIAYGGIALSVWDGELLVVDDRRGRRPKDRRAASVSLEQLVGDPAVRQAAAELSRLYQAARCVIVISIQSWSWTHVDVHRVMDGGDVAIEERVGHLRRVMGMW